MRIVMLPGIGGSGEAHWQTLWERADPTIVRFAPASWDAPDRADWCAALTRAVVAEAAPPLLVAHSLGCLLVGHWAATASLPRVRGAFLVAPPDPDGRAFPDAAASFRRVPHAGLPFPALLVASSDDPYASLQFARKLAADWGAGLVEAGALGHVNAASGLGTWPQGAALLTAFRAGLSPAAGIPRS